MLGLGTAFVATLSTFRQDHTEDYALINTAGINTITSILFLFPFSQRRFIDSSSSCGLGGA